MKRPREDDGDQQTTTDGKRPASAPAPAERSKETDQQTKRPASASASAPASAVDISREGGGGGGRPSPRLYVGGLHRSVTEGDILKLFLPYGKIVKEDFPFHFHGPKKGEPRGYCFLEFERTAEAARAIAALDGRELRGRRLLVRYAREQEAMPTDPRSFLSKAQAKAKAKAGLPLPVEKPPSVRTGGGGEESALDAKIRALKAMLRK